MPPSNSVNLANITPEILGQILMFHLQALGRAEFMRELGSVFLTCKYWNAVISSIPGLWCDIEVALDSRIKLPFLSIAAIKSWLSRSKGLPLNLVISFQHLRRSVDSSDGRRYAEVAFELFLAQLVRWRSVSLNFDHVSPPRFLLVSMQERLPLFWKLSMSCSILGVAYANTGIFHYTQLPLLYGTTSVVALMGLTFSLIPFYGTSCHIFMWSPLLTREPF